MKFKIVQEFEVKIPERGTKNRQRLEGQIRSELDEGDAAVILSKDDALAVWVFWQVGADHEGDLLEPYILEVHGEYDPRKWVAKVMASSHEIDQVITKIEEDNNDG